jgi:hypothetical protein
MNPHCLKSIANYFLGSKYKLVDSPRVAADICDDFFDEKHEPSMKLILICNTLLGDISVTYKELQVMPNLIREYE